MSIALIMMGGSGTRFGAAIPKQFVEIEGRPVFSYLVEAYQEFDCVDRIIIVCHADWREYTSRWCEMLGVSKLVSIIGGGENRSHSVQRGLEAARRVSSDDEVVLIHDVTHPFIDKDNVKKCIKLASDYGAATLAAACFDTMYSIDAKDRIDSVEQRERLVSATAPECFRIGSVWPFYEGKSVEDLGKMSSSGAMMVSNGQTVCIVKTPLINLKITLHEDMEAFKKLLHGYYYDEEKEDVI